MNGATDLEVRPHPAKFNAALLAELARLIWLEAHRLRRARRPVRVLDPFGGTGRLQWCAGGPVHVVAGDLELEWLTQAPGDTVRADACRLPFGDDTFDVVATSPTYGNRMADRYDGRDGSRRHTYRIDLDRMPTAGSSAVMQWGDEYRQLHAQAWAEAARIIRPGGLLIVNVKDHKRRGEWQQVPAWHADAMSSAGFDLEAELDVAVDGLRDGTNHDDRAEHEQLLVGRLTATKECSQ